MNEHFDCIVIGIGGIGSAASYFASQKNWSVLGIEQFSPAHNLGSSHGQSRIIRQAYFEHPSYVPLVLRAYQAWANIEQESENQLFYRTGLLQVGWPDNEVIQGVQTSAEQHNLPVENLSAADCAKRFPQFTMPDDQIGVFESTAGYLLVEECVKSMIELAAKQGAQFLFEQKVDSVEFKNDQFIVQVGEKKFIGDRLVISAGAWANTLLNDLGIPLQVIAKHQHWFQFENESLFENSPVYLFETDQGYFYGFPKIGNRGFKVAEHTSGSTVSNPHQLDRSLCETDLKRVSDFVNQRLRANHAVHCEHSLCMYTMSVDEHFVIDRHPEIPKLVFACGMSGHGFKFTPVVGRHLVSLLDDANWKDEDFNFLRMRERMPS